MKTIQTKKNTSTRKVFALVAYGSRNTLHLKQIKKSIYAKKSLSRLSVLQRNRIYISGCTKPVIIMTDSKSVTRFSQTKMITAFTCNTCDFVLLVNFPNAHIPGKKNTDADFLSRSEKDPNEKIFLKSRENIPTKTIVKKNESKALHKRSRSFLKAQTSTTPQKKYSKIVKKKHKKPYQMIHQSSQ